MKRLLYLLLGLSSCAQVEKSTELPIMGTLPIGEHSVGYQTLFEYDKTKRGVPSADWAGHLTLDHQPELGRQYQINVWYPATRGSGQSLTYAHYVELTGRQTNFGKSETQMEAAKTNFVSKTNDLSNKDDFTVEELEQLMRLDVLARHQAKPMGGPYPVVLFPNGGSPAFQSITCEFLASHGYVVVAFAPKGRFSSVMETSAIGLETAVDDLEFVLGKISQLPFADVRQVSILANAIASSVGAAAVSRNIQIQALISLEGGFPSAFEQRLLNETVFYQPENIQIPILFIYAPHPSIDPTYTFHLKYADRYYAHFKHMSEFVMLNYGMFNAFVPDILGEHSGNVQSGFEAANELVLRFLNQQTKEASGILFENDFLQARPHIDTTFVLPGLEAPPNIAELKNQFWTAGFDGIENLYHEMKRNGNQQPFSLDFYSAYRTWLAWQKDDTYDYRWRLYQLAFDSYPESAIVNYYLGSYSGRLGKNEQAIRHYEIALRTVDSDPNLNVNEKAIIRSRSQEELKKLNPMK